MSSPTSTTCSPCSIPSHRRRSLLGNSLQIHGSNSSSVGTASISPRAGTADPLCRNRVGRGRHRRQGRRRGRHQRVLVVHPIVFGNLGLQGNSEGVQILLPKEDPISLAAVNVVALVMKLCDPFGSSVRQTGLGRPLSVRGGAPPTSSGRGGRVVA